MAEDNGMAGRRRWAGPDSTCIGCPAALDNMVFIPIFPLLVLLALFSSSTFPTSSLGNGAELGNRIK